MKTGLYLCIRVDTESHHPPTLASTAAMSNSNSFQILLEAEQQASALVNEARQYRAQRLKDARREALEEIEELKRKKSEELVENEKKHAGELEKNVTDFEESVKLSLQTCSDQISAHRREVLDLLLNGVKRCDPHIHPNAALKLKLKGKKSA